jgi:hypothetical protein
VSLIATTRLGKSRIGALATMEIFLFWFVYRPSLLDTQLLLDVYLVIFLGLSDIKLTTHPQVVNTDCCYIAPPSCVITGVLFKYLISILDIAAVRSC